MPRQSNPFSSTLVFAGGFLALILIGTILLSMPFSSASGEFTNPIISLFTSTSAVCVTGLTVVDTGSYWSTFGQAVIFCLFQLGGLGFIIGATLLILAIGGRFGLKDRLLVSESMGIDQLGGVLGLVIRVAIFTLVLEALGTVALYLRWHFTGAADVSLWTAIFHAASSFNNCGMDIFGNAQSLSAYSGDAVVLLTTAILVIIGAVGWVVLVDFFKRRRFNKMALDSKIVLLVSFSLLLVGTVFYLVAEYSGTLAGLSFPQKLLEAFFHSTVARTAGFSVVDVGNFQQITLFFTMFLMCVGGAAGSTAGGIKVNTFGILLITIWNVLRGRDVVSIYGRQISRGTVYRAISLTFFYLGLVGLFVIILTITENLPIDKIFFEVFSALSTVGLSTGITSLLSPVSQVVLVLAMFIGRLSPLAFIAYIEHHKQSVDLDFPHENIRMG
jgi:trk system potassium uptake protein TrkH